jgi:hypothetical protein
MNGCALGTEFRIYTYVFDFCGAVERRLRGAVAVAICVDGHSGDKKMRMIVYEIKMD